METPQRQPDVERLRQEARSRVRALEKKVKDLPKGGTWPKRLYASNEIIGPRNSVSPVNFIDTLVSLGEDQALVLEADGFWYNNTGVVQTFALGMGFGETTIYSDTSGNLTSTATVRPWTLKVRLSRVTRELLAGVGSIKIPTAVAASVGAGDLATAAIEYVFGTSDAVAVNFGKRNRLTAGFLLSAADANLYMEAHRTVLYVE